MKDESKKASYFKIRKKSQIKSVDFEQGLEMAVR